MMGQLRFEQEVERRIAPHAHLLPIFTSLFKIPERIREWDPAAFLVRNCKRILQKMDGLPSESWAAIPYGVVPNWQTWLEVHSLDYHPYTFMCVVRYPGLDARLLEHLRSIDIKARGDEISQEIDRANEAAEKSKLRNQQDLTSSLARDLRRPLARLDWGPTVFGPGGPPRR